MKIGNEKELKSIAEENSGHLDFKDFLKKYNYCTNEPYSFMMVDNRPTALVTFKKTLMNQYVQSTSSLERRFTTFLNNDS